MGKLDSTPSHKMNEHMRGRLTQQKARKFEHLCEKERCMGKPEAFPIHMTNEHTTRDARKDVDISRSLG